MAWPKGKPRGKKVVGSDLRADPASAPVSQSWNTDKLEGEAPDFAYQFMRENEVRDRTRPDTVFDRRTGETKRIPGWTVCNESDDGALRMMGSRPDLGVPTDTVMRMGPHVLMKIPKAAWELLQHRQDNAADANEARIMRGGMVSEDDGVSVASVAYPTHPAQLGNEGGHDYSQKEMRLTNKLAELSGR